MVGRDGSAPALQFSDRRARSGAYFPTRHGPSHSFVRRGRLRRPASGAARLRRRTGTRFPGRTLHQRGLQQLSAGRAIPGIAPGIGRSLARDRAPSHFMSTTGTAAAGPTASRPPRFTRRQYDYSRSRHAQLDLHPLLHGRRKRMAAPGPAAPAQGPARHFAGRTGGGRRLLDRIRRARPGGQAARPLSGRTPPCSPGASSPA